MRIVVHFHFNKDENPVATTEVHGEITDVILPCVGDFVRHRHPGGERFMGKVTERIYDFDLPNGIDVRGTVTVTLCLDRMQFN